MRVPTETIEVNGRRKTVNADDPRVADYAVSVGEPDLSEQQPMTPDDIDAMDGGDLTELLEAHGVEDIPRRLDDRREMLKSIMFVSL